MTFFSYEKVEFFFSNFSFVCLFFSMVAFWFQLTEKIYRSRPISFEQKGKALPEVQSLKNSKLFLQTNSDISLEQTSATNLENMKAEGGALVGSALEQSLSKNRNWGEAAIFTANFSLFVLLSLRWVESGHFPLSNLYESLMFLSWALTFFHLFLQQFTGQAFSWLGAITAPTSLLTNAFANFSLPMEMQRSSALVPALQSNWLMMHVTVMILSYAALIFGCLLSIGFLILTMSISSKDYETKIANQSSNGFSGLVHRVKPEPKIQWAQNLDNLSYRMLGIGFPLLTIGILSGAVWANEAWGSYWSWDPKETWALLTWLIFAIYLHTRITKNWQGKKPAMIASFGFFVVWVCYLGVNLLGEGLHSYGWLSS